VDTEVSEEHTSSIFRIDRYLYVLIIYFVIKNTTKNESSTDLQATNAMEQNPY
jgi:hypothetical protein